MLFERQKHLLALVDVLGGNIGNLDFQKLLFFYCQESGDAPSYEFVPYKYGGFSFTSYADKRKLISQGMLEDKENFWTLTSKGRKVSLKDTPERNRMDQFAKHHAKLRGNALVAKVYRDYPYYAIQSEMAERVLGLNSVAFAAVAAARPAKGKPGICTIGYEGLTLEGYLNKLLRDGVTLLCDVRRNPLSRKYGFSKSTLAKGCEGVGLRYEHLPEFGIASEDRRELDTQADYDALFAIYEKKNLPLHTGSLNKIREWVDQGARVALTCFERLPHQCHRHCVAEALEHSFGVLFAPTHL